MADQLQALKWGRVQKDLSTPSKAIRVLSPERQPGREFCVISGLPVADAPDICKISRDSILDLMGRGVGRLLLWMSLFRN